MKSIRAIFMKQALDCYRNKMVLIQYTIFPLIAAIFTELVAKPQENIPDMMFVMVFAPIFAGMSMITIVAGVIAEDREKNSLRFLRMAGVKPQEYLLGVTAIMLVAAVSGAIVFGLIGGFRGLEFFAFVLIMVLSAIASMFLGAAIGIFFNNQQAASAVAMPVAMVLGFGPMITMFNDTARKVLSCFYTQQLSESINNLHGDLGWPLMIIAGNIVVFFVVFYLSYQKKGLN